MDVFVSSRRVSIAAAIASLLILWAIIVIPGGPAWPGFVSLSVLAVLLVATAKIVLAAASPASMSAVIHGVEGEKTADPMPVAALSSAAR